MSAPILAPPDPAATPPRTRPRAWRDGPLHCSPGGQFTLFLDRHGYVTGCAPAGAAPVGWHLAELYAPEGRARGEPGDDLADAARLGSITAAGWWSRGDGSRCWVEATLTALRGAAGTTAGHALVVRDASAAREAEEALRLSEARLAGIVELAREAIVSVDEADRVILFNRGAERVFGHAAAEVLGGPFERLLAGEYREAHAGELLELDGGAGRWRREGDVGEVAARRADGTVFPAAASVASVEVAGRRVFTWVLRDVSAEKRAAAESAFLLRAGSALAASLAPDRILATAAGLATEWLAELCVVETTEGRGHPRRRAAAGATPRAREVAERLAAPPSDADDLAAAGWPARGVLHAVPLAVHGRALGTLTLARGDGDALPADDARVAGEFAERVSLALESALLYEQACRAARLRDEMVSVVSHDLRSPLSAIAMTASLLEEAAADGALPPGWGRRVEVIRRSAEQMARMVEELLDVARIESGHLALAPRRLAASALLAEAEQLLRPQAEAAGVALEVAEAEELPPVWGDPDRLQQVLANLVGNALKFTPPGGVVSLRAGADEDGGTRFEVRDTGVGIPAGDLPFVFDRFWQAGRADRRGLGLGLPIVRGIVEAHGGRVGVESEAGRGSVFRVSLPPAPPP